MIKRQKMREDFNKNIQELASKEDKVAKDVEKITRSLAARVNSLNKDTRKMTKIYKKKKAELERRLSKNKTRREKMIRERASTRRQNVFSSIREIHQRPPVKPDDSMNAAGRRRR
jgi:hypothetical protein